MNYVQPLGGISMADEIKKQQLFDQQQAQYKQEQEDKARMSELAMSASRGNADAISELWGLNPQFAQVFEDRERKLVAEKGLKYAKDVKQAETDWGLRWKQADAPEKKQQLLQEALQNPLIDIDEQDVNIQGDGADLAVNSLLFSHLGKDQYKAMFGEDKTKYEQGTGVMQGYTFNPNTGEYSVSDDVKGKIKNAAVTGLDAKTRQSINKDLTQLTKDTTNIYKTAKDLDKLRDNPSGPAAIAMVFKFMKALDPTSVVREGEFATAEGSSGVPDKLANYFNKLLSGERLADSQIDDFVTTAKVLSNSAVNSSSEEINSYLDTFEDSIPKSFKQKLKSRIPKLFDIEDNDPLGLL